MTAPENPLSLRRLPMLRALLPLVAGLVAARGWMLPPIFLVAAFGACLLLALRLGGRREAGWYVAGAIFLLGMLLPAVRPVPAGGMAFGALHEAAVERLGRLNLSPEAQALCRAMAAGDVVGITPELRAVFSRSGAAHLLAVSGLHVGIVFLLANTLLGWIVLLRRGHLWRNAAVVAAVWVYAVMTGLSPSTLRAALMFSCLQVALMTSSPYVGLNVLCGTAFAALVWRPGDLFGLSFQLSYLAVAAILLWAVPLMRRLRTRRRAIDWLVESLCVGVAASAATAPLVSHCFGVIPVAGVLLGGVVVLLAYGIVMGAVVWMAVPWSPLAGPAGGMLEALCGALLGVTRGVAGWSWAAVDYRMSVGQMAVVYLFFAAATLAAYRKPKKSVSLPLR